MKLARAVILTAGAGIAVARAAEPLSESQVRAYARDAARESRGDATELVLGLDRRVREQVGDFESFPISIIKDANLLVTVSAPYMSFRRSLVDMLRSGQRLEQAVWIGAVVVTVAPQRIESADVESVSLTRGGRSVAPLKNSLRPATFSDGRGEERIIHAGEVHFPVASFDPGSTVLLTLARRGADPVVYAFSEAELKSLK